MNFRFVLSTLNRPPFRPNKTLGRLVLLPPDFRVSWYNSVMFKVGEKPIPVPPTSLPLILVLHWFPPSVDSQSLLGYPNLLKQKPVQCYEGIYKLLFIPIKHV